MKFCSAPILVKRMKDVAEPIPIEQKKKNENLPDSLIKVTVGIQKGRGSDTK